MMFFNWLFYCIAIAAAMCLLFVMGYWGFMTLCIGASGICIYKLVELEEEK